MVVTATYKDGSTAVVTDYTVLPEDALKSVDTYVLISYQGKTAEQPVKVKDKKVTGIAITTPPKKTEYIEGQSFDAGGMVVIAAYNDGKSLPIHAYSVSRDPLTTTDTSVTVSYEGHTSSQPITVIAKAETGIAITTPPTATKYVEGQTFDPAGMVVSATYNDGTTAPVTGYTITPDRALATTDITVTVEYEGHTATQAITVIAKVVTDIAITTPPNKLNYIEGQVFEKDGMVVTATYNDGTEAPITDYTVPAEALAVGTTAITHGSYVLDDRMTLIVNDNIVPTGYTFHSLGGSYSWWPWQWVTVENLDLLSGTNSVTFKFISKDNAPNFDRFEIVVTEYDGVAAAIEDITLMDGDCVVQTGQSGSYKVESEWFDYSSCTVTGGKGYVESADAGGGKYVGPAFAAANNKIRLHIWVDEAATMSMDLRMALTGGSAVNDILTCKVNDTPYEWASDTTFTSTSATDWNNIVLGDITLKAGINTVVLETKTATIPNIDYGTFNITFA